MMTPSIAQLLMSGGQAPPRMRQRDPLVGQMPGGQQIPQQRVDPPVGEIPSLGHIPQRRVDPPVHHMNGAQYKRWLHKQPPGPGVFPGPHPVPIGYGTGPLA